MAREGWPVQQMRETEEEKPARKPRVAVAAEVHPK
jgi:hypothetical protein